MKAGMGVGRANGRVREGRSLSLPAQRLKAQIGFTFHYNGYVQKTCVPHPSLSIKPFQRMGRQFFVNILTTVCSCQATYSRRQRGLTKMQAGTIFKKDRRE